MGGGTGDGEIRRGEERTGGGKGCERRGRDGEGGREGIRA